MTFEILHRPDAPDTAIVSISGRLDAYSAENMERDLEQEIDEGSSSIVLDFSDCEYLSSTGLRVLFSLLNRLGQDREALCLVGVRPQVRKIFIIADCIELFRFCETLEDALCRGEAAP